MRTYNKTVINAAVFCIAGIVGAGLVMQAYDNGRATGFIEGSAEGFTAGLKSKREPPKVYIITPKPDGTFTIPKKEVDKDSVLWRL
jgi:hypothetical protein